MNPTPRHEKLDKLIVSDIDPRLKAVMQDLAPGTKLVLDNREVEKYGLEHAARLAKGRLGACVSVASTEYSENDLRSKIAKKLLDELKTAGAVKETNPKDAIGGKKVPLWLCSAIAKAHWALAQFAGLLKYGAWNFRVVGVRSSVYISALHRHIDAYENGEEYDPVDGTHHLGNIMACAAILLEAREIGKLTDDRPPRVDIRPTYDFVESQMAELRAKYAQMAPKHYTIADDIGGSK